MKTVKQQAEVSFKLLDFSDKVVMLPIIDRFANAIRTNCDISIIELNSHNNRTTEITIDNTKKMFKILSDLGCRTSLGESYEDIIKSDNSQNEKQKRYILHLFDTGQNRIEAIKRIKTQLNLSAEDARKLVDSCPTDIDLHKYKIERPNYEILFNSLKQIGCICNLTTKEQ